MRPSSSKNIQTSDPVPSGLDALQHSLSYCFKTVHLLEQALTHKSYANEVAKAVTCDNERLEFLGDAVLDLVIRDALMAQFPDAPEGALSKMKAVIVSRGALWAVAHQIHLGRFLILGKGEERTFGREKASLLANAVEAVIGAIYQDGGFKAARTAVRHLFSSALQKLHQPDVPMDSKTVLQEFCQKRLSTLPVYQIIRESGADHQKRFEVNVQIGNLSYATGVGTSKRMAEQMAAQEALSRIVVEYA